MPLVMTCGGRSARKTLASFVSDVHLPPRELAALIRGELVTFGAIRVRADKRRPQKERRTLPKSRRRP